MKAPADMLYPSDELGPRRRVQFVLLNEMGAAAVEYAILAAAIAAVIVIAATSIGIKVARGFEAVADLMP